jgi:hypothetical protein
VALLLSISVEINASACRLLNAGANDLKNSKRQQDDTGRQQAQIHMLSLFRDANSQSFAELVLAGGDTAVITKLLSIYSGNVANGCEYWVGNTGKNT